MASRPDLKVEDEASFIKFFRGISSDGAGDDTIRVFDRGDQYTAHGDDAYFIARTVYKTTSVIKTIGRDPGLASTTMTITVFRNFLREVLFRLGRRIEVWGNDTSKRMAWRVIKQASPGNLQDVEEDLGGHIESAPVILAVKVSSKATEARNVGICFADASVRELGVSEFLDNDLYSNFESTLIQLGARECLLQSDGGKKDPELAKLRQIAENCNCAVSEKPAVDFGVRDIEEDLSRLLKGDNPAKTMPQTDLKLAMGSAAALIKYLGVMNDASNFGQYQLYQHDLSQYMKLDASALKALNLMPGPRDGAKTMSLYGLLNHCRTPIGSRLLAQWLKQPLMDKAEIEKRQQLVESFVMDTQLRQSMQEEYLRKMPDMYRLAKKFQRKKASLEDVVRVYQVTVDLPPIVATLDAVMDERYKDPLNEAYTAKLKACSDSFARLQEMVETTIDLEAMDRHEFIIKPEYDEGLRVIRRKLNKLSTQMDAELRRVSDDLDQDIDKKLFLENHRVHGWCFRLTRNEASCIRSKRAYQEISTQKMGVFFTTDTLRDLRREHDDLSASYDKTQSGLASEVITVAGSYTPVLERLAAVIAHLDVIVSFAHASAYAPTPYTRPTLHPRASECLSGNLADAGTTLREVRHPCLEQQDDVAFITNDITLSPTGPSFLIITGPNMGGKSTYIRMIACIALLAQVGCFVPCAPGASINIFDSILARVGASDSQLKGVSTFMAEMLETANILKSATRDSLIIVDELGRGTSTYDGFGLAWAIAEHIISKIGAMAAFATHFHELTRLAETWAQVRNLHVVAHVSDAEPDRMDVDADAHGKRREVTLLYRVEEGVSDQSFGIHVAELVRFPPKVVNMARRKAAELEAFESHLNHSNDGKDVDTAAATRAALAASPAEVEQGSRLLKGVLKEWSARVAGKELGKEEQMRVMRELVAGNEELLGNPFFQGIKAL